MEMNGVAHVVGFIFFEKEEFITKSDICNCADQYESYSERMNYISNI